jgi:hypothetical protein
MTYVLGQISGHILVDGKPRDEGFHHKIGYVEQVWLCGRCVFLG